MSETKKQFTTFTEIPQARLLVKVRNTLVGVGAIALALWLRKNNWFPEWLGVGLIIFGGFAISQDLVKRFAGFLPAAIHDIRAALRNGR
jgi:hypothetical protein